MPATLTIGRLAEAAGVNVETIRYYQRRGLLPLPARPPGGQRRYPPALVKRLGFIKRAQALGFSLADVERLLGFDGACACSETRALAVEKLGEIERKIADLEAMRRVLGALVKQCAADDGGGACPIIDELSEA